MKGKEFMTAEEAEQAIDEVAMERETENSKEVKKMTEEMICKMVMDGDLFYHHEAKKSGCMSKKDSPLIKEYEGRFGKGYTVERRMKGSSRYHYVTYYVE